MPLIPHALFYDLKKKKANGKGNNFNSSMNLISYRYIPQKNKILRIIDGKDDHFDRSIHTWTGDLK